MTGRVCAGPFSAMFCVSKVGMQFKTFLSYFTKIVVAKILQHQKSLFSLTYVSSVVLCGAV